MAAIEVSPSEIDAAANVILGASDALGALRGGLGGAGDFGDALPNTSLGYRELATDWVKAAQQMADAVESLGAALRGAAEVYRETDNGAMRAP